MFKRYDRRPGKKTDRGLKEGRRAWRCRARSRSYAEVSVDGMHLVLCHYPFRTWRNMGKGWANLHGHSHGRLKSLPRQCDVGVEVWDFRPVQIGEVLGSKKSHMRAPT